MDRRRLIGHTLALSGLAGLSAYAMGPRQIAASARTAPLAPYRLSPERIIDIRCCLRPFRPMGPRLDTETIGDKLFILRRLPAALRRKQNALNVCPLKKVS